MTWTLDDVIEQLTLLRNAESAGDWPVVIRSYETCVDLGIIDVSECVNGPVVEIWFDEES